MNLPEPIGEVALAFFQKLLGPVAEVGELLSDKIRFFRWKSSLKIIKKAEAIARENNIKPKEVPLKFLVPFLEKSSLEEEDSELSSRWANLLASAVNDPKEADISLIDVLAKLGSREVKTLEEMISPDRAQVILEENDPFVSFVMRAAANRFALGAMVSSSIMKFDPGTPEEIEDLCAKYIDVAQPNAVVESIEYRIVDSTGNDKLNIVANPAITDGMQVSSYETLISAGLLSRSSYVNRLKNLELSITVLTPTLLGFRLVTQCRGDRLKMEHKS